MLRGLCTPLSDKSASPTWFGSLDLGGLQGADAVDGSRREFRELERPQQNVDLSWPDTKPYSQNIQPCGRPEQWMQTDISGAEGLPASAVVLESTTLL